MKIKSLEESDRNRVIDSVRRAYFWETQNLNWTIGIIRSSSFRGEELAQIFNEIRNFARPQDLPKLEMLIERCEREGFL